jgi:excisionase family DNA binding protein
MKMALARIRTIKGAAAHQKEKDPGTMVGEWFIRQLILSGKLKCHRSGNRYLVDLDRLEAYLENPPEEKSAVVEYGKLRKVQQTGK